MTVDVAFDILLCLLVIAIAFGAVSGRDLFAGVALYVVYGLLLAIAWVRLGAVDVALAEGAIGAGLTGVLLLGAVARLHRTSPERKQPVSRAVVLAAIPLCLALAGGLMWVAVDLARPSMGLRPLVEHHLPLSGAENPVTAVLLNFRGWDTLLEAVVLLIALIGVWALTPDRLWGGRPGFTQHVRDGGVLATFGRVLPPLGLVAGIYLVWVGTSAPGGAFQGGTVLAAVWLLAIMAALTDPPRVSSAGLRWAIAAGPLLFLAVGLWGLGQGAFLAYPPERAKEYILAIEFLLALSIAATLALVVVGPPRRAP